MAGGEGPSHAVVALGCAGWGAGQLEQELIEDSWLTVPVDAEPVVRDAAGRALAGRGRAASAWTSTADYTGHA